jgi:hypothetical protein
MADELQALYRDKLAAAEKPRHRRADPYEEASARLDKMLEQAQPAEAPEATPPAVEPPPASIPPKDQAGLQRKIQAGMLPQKSAWDNVLESLGESNRAVGSALLDKTLFGVPAKLDEAVEGLPPGTHARIAADNPLESTMAGLPAAAIDTATMSGPASAASEAIAPLVRGARPALQTAAKSAAGGALFGGSDAALRGGDLSDVGQGMAQGAAGNLALSTLPPVAAKLEEAANNAIMSRAAKPLLAVGQGKAANKTQLTLGSGDKELGKQELKRVIEEEGLEPTIRKNPGSLGNVVREKQNEVWEKELGPIRQMALTAEPDAKIPLAKIRERLTGILGEEAKGTDAHDDVDKAIGLLQSRAEKIGNKGQFPIKNLLKNAQEFERDGYGGTEAKFADKQTARAIGKTLRSLVDERISTIYQRNPALTAKALGRAPEDLGMGRPFARTSDLDLETLGGKYRAALERYADLKGIEPAAEQYASRMGQERHPGLISAIKQGLARTAGAVVGGHLAGAPGAMLGFGAAELPGKLAGPVQRGARALAAPLAGPAVNPGVAGATAARLTIPELQERVAQFLARRKRLPQ